MDGTLVFVYNADSGVMNGLLDLAHKTLSPATYGCNLCAITYGPLGMKRAWRDAIASLGRPVRFLHRDEVAREFGLTDVALPAVYCVENGALVEWMSAAEMNAFDSLEALTQAVQARSAQEHNAQESALRAAAQ